MYSDVIKVQFILVENIVFYSRQIFIYDDYFTKLDYVHGGGRQLHNRQIDSKEEYIHLDFIEY